MANEECPCPCDIGDKFEYEGLGHEVQIEHFKAYICRPLSATDRAVIVVQDIYGWDLPNTRFIVDLLAANGYMFPCLLQNPSKHRYTPGFRKNKCIWSDKKVDGKIHKRWYDHLSRTKQKVAKRKKKCSIHGKREE